MIKQRSNLRKLGTFCKLETMCKCVYTMCKRPDQKTSRTWNEKGRLINICHIYEVPQFILYISFHVDPSFNCMPSFYLVLYMRIYIFFVKKFVQNALPEI